jgi:uncharacterized membrane protein
MKLNKAGAQQMPQARVDVAVCFDGGTLLWVPFSANLMAHGFGRGAVQR